MGALQEKGVTFIFSLGTTSISFPSPSSHPDVPAFSFNAIICRRLSFLNCDFVLPSSPVPVPLPDPSFDHDAALLANFPPASLTPELWHRRFGHLGKMATHAAITKDYATGITSTGNFEKLQCIACLIGKRPQLPFSNAGHCATNIGELLHIDVCGPFPTLTLRSIRTL